MFMKISSWDGREMTCIKQVKIHDLIQIPNELEWIKNNNIYGNFELIAENDDEEELSKIMSYVSNKSHDLL